MSTTTPVRHVQTDIITVTRLGHTFKASRRTVAWLDYLIWQFNRTFPKARLVMLQSCYHQGVQMSAGTHDYDAVFDLWFVGKIPGLTLKAQGMRFSRFMRNRGASGGWFRYYGDWKSPAEWHYHGFPLPVGLERFPTRVGRFIDGGESGLRLAGVNEPGSSQLQDYVETNALGLAGQHAFGSDPTRRQKPKDLNNVVFNYRAWTAVHGVPRGIDEAAREDPS
jgi:hypothetical protein